MKKLKCDETLDRLSDLPDSVILQILSLLDMRDVVGTTVLSKRWQNLWTTIPCLDFDEMDKSAVETRNFVNRALMLWKGAKIQRFKLDISENGFPELDCDIDLWMRFVAGRSVEELCLHIHEIESEEYVLPQFILSCFSITNLSVLGVYLEVRGVVHWHHLKSLEIHVYSVSEDTINRVVSGTPRLEVFVLTVTSEAKENLSIQSSSLKRLSVTCLIDYFYNTSDLSKNAMLTIWAPNLEALVVSGLSYTTCLMKDVSSLTDVTLDYSEARNGAIRKILMEILPAFRHVEVITLSSWCFKELRVIKGEYSLSPLVNVKQLSLTYDRVGHHELIDLFEIFPKLNKLDIDRKVYCSKQDIAEWLSSGEYIMKTLMMPLRKVEIGWHVYETSLFQFIEYFLKHATKLEKMVIQKRGSLEVEFDEMVMAAEKLLGLQRSFPTVEFLVSAKKW